MISKSPEVIKHLIGHEYVEGIFESENSEHVRLAYREIAKVNQRLFDLIPYKVEFTEEEGYLTAKEMREMVVATGTIKIYTGWSGHPFLTQEENSIGRAVHDVWAHMVCGCPFSFEGEYNAYLEQRKHYPEWTWGVLFAEIPAQTSAYYFSGSFGYEQRAIEAPQHWIEWCKLLKSDYSANSVLKFEFAI